MFTSYSAAFGRALLVGQGERHALGDGVLGNGHRALAPLLD
jgi:hypothetical protein